MSLKSGGHSGSHSNPPKLLQYLGTALGESRTHRRILREMGSENDSSCIVGLQERRIRCRIAPHSEFLLNKLSTAYGSLRVSKSPSGRSTTIPSEGECIWTGFAPVRFART